MNVDLDVRVCDFPMGGGKTQSMIAEINHRVLSDESFKVIVLLVQRTECYRIRDGCPGAKFIVPEKTSENRMSVCSQTEMLMKDGRNIASTHAAFLYYTDEIRSLAKEYGYSLYIDEAMEAVTLAKNINPVDVRNLEADGYIRYDDELGVYVPDEDRIHNLVGGMYDELARMMISRGLARCDRVGSKDKNITFYLWIIPVTVFINFRDVTILTFNFETLPMAKYFKMMGVDYQAIGVKRTEQGEYRFTAPGELPDYPTYLDGLKDKVHIVETNKMRYLDYYGRRRTAMSVTWFKNPDNAKMVGRDIDNFFKNIGRKLTDCNGAEYQLWAVYNGSKIETRGTCRNYSDESHLAYSTKAINDKAHTTLLAYAVSPFIHVDFKRFWMSNGFEMGKHEDDMFALNNMIQWIWRSRIRKDEEVWVFLPSNRMRELLRRWLNDPLEYSLCNPNNFNQ